MSNVEQGISNDEVKSLLLFPSVFVIRHSSFDILRFAFDPLRSLRRSPFLEF